MTEDEASAFQKLQAIVDGKLATIAADIPTKAQTIAEEELRPELKSYLPTKARPVAG